MACKYVVRKRQLGDVLWIEPVIKALAARYKKVIVHTKSNVLFNNYPYPNVVFKDRLALIEKIILNIEKIFRISFLFINLDDAYEKRPNMHFLHAYQQQAELALTEEYPNIYLDKKETDAHLAGPSKYVVLHLESFSDKNYRKIHGPHWELIVAHLNKTGFAVVQVGKEPAPIAGSKFIKTNIRELMSLIKHSSFFIGLDSGPSHIAASMSIPSLIFFGAIDPEYRHFKKLFRGFFLQQYCEFAGCYHMGTAGVEPVCRLVGDTGVPKCSLHSSEQVVTYIDLLINKFIKKNDQ